MNVLEKDVKKLLYKHDYITIVQKAGDGCIITYPHPKLLNDFPRLIESFVFQRGDKPGFWESTSYDKEGETEYFREVPEYAFRLYVVCEISACNNSIPIAPSLMVFLNENNEEKDDIEDILSPPSTDEDQKKEGFLYRLVIEARNDGFPSQYDKVAKTHGVDVGYTIIRKFYE